MFDAMKDGAIIANSGHFNVEINIPHLRERAVSVREVRPLVEEFVLEDGRTIYLLADGRLVNLSAQRAIPRASWTCRSPTRRWPPSTWSSNAADSRSRRLPRAG